MPRPTILLKRSLIFVHRWLGVALAILFMLWFASGIVMMYWDFPSADQATRLDRAPVLDPAKIKLTPEQAYAALESGQPAPSVQLTSFDGRPVYRFGGGGGRGGRRGGGAVSMVYADDGTLQDDFTDEIIDRTAAAWARQPASAARKEEVLEKDQWTVGINLGPLAPVYKYSFPDGQQVYVSGYAEAVQYTTTESRFWAWLGAIPHWMYFTPLRKHQPQWFGFVVWTSGIGTIAAILGIVIAVWMLSPSKRYRHAGVPTSIPYKGWKRWHTILGLFFGVVTTTWAFSGLLSMGPFDFVDRITGTGRPANKGKDAKAKGKRGGGGPTGFNLATVLRGPGRFSLAAYAPKPPQEALAAIADFHPKELDWTMFAGEPIYMATDSEGHTRIIPVKGDPKPEFDRDQILSMIREAGGSQIAELRMMDEYDAYYLDRHGERPLPVIYARLNDESSTRYYVDPKTGRVAGNYSSRNWVNRWLYHGLHSLDFPWLYKHRPLWDIVVIALMLGGTAVCVTSLLLAWRVLQRKIAAIIKARFTPTNDDLVTE